MNSTSRNLNETKTKKLHKVDEPRSAASLKIVGVVDNLTNDGNIYYIAKNDKDYFIFIGQKCVDADDYFIYDFFDETGF